MEAFDFRPVADALMRSFNPSPAIGLWIRLREEILERCPQMRDPRVFQRNEAVMFELVLRFYNHVRAPALPADGVIRLTEMSNEDRVKIGYKLISVSQVLERLRKGIVEAEATAGSPPPASAHAMRLTDDDGSSTASIEELDEEYVPEPTPKAGAKRRAEAHVSPPHAPRKQPRTLIARKLTKKTVSNPKPAAAAKAAAAKPAPVITLDAFMAALNACMKGSV